MTVSNTNLRSPATGGYACDGANQDFAGTFTIQAAEDVDVILRDADGAETTLTLTSDYTVTPTTDYQTDSFTVTTVATYDATYTITLIRGMARTQPNKISNSGRYNPAVVMSNDDRNLLLIQQNAEELNRCIKQNASDPTALDNAAYLAACVAAQAGAETAETGAETAETNAETAEAGAAASLATMQASGVYLTEYTSLSAAITAIGATEVELIIDKDDTMSGNVVIPTNVALRFINDSVITTVSNTLTINCPITAGNQKIFDITGGTLNGTPLSNASIAWFGAVGDDTTDDVIPITEAMSSTFKHISLVAGKTYLTSDEISPSSGVTFDLNGSTIKAMPSFPNTSNIILIENSGVIIKNGVINGNRSNLIATFAAGSFGNGVRVTDGGDESRVISITTHDCPTNGQLVISSSAAIDDVKFIDYKSYDNAFGGIGGESQSNGNPITNVQFLNGEVYGNDLGGDIRIQGIDGFLIDGHNGHDSDHGGLVMGPGEAYNTCRGSIVNSKIGNANPGLATAEIDAKVGGSGPHAGKIAIVELYLDNVLLAGSGNGSGLITRNQALVIGGVVTSKDHYNNGYFFTDSIVQIETFISKNSVTQGIILNTLVEIDNLIVEEWGAASPAVTFNAGSDGSRVSGRFGAIINETGTHDSGNNEAIMTDSTASFTIDEHVGRVIRNTIDGSRGTITANTATTVTATLAGGTDNDWDTNDAYEITAETGKNGVTQSGSPANIRLGILSYTGWSLDKGLVSGSVANTWEIYNQGAVNMLELEDGIAAPAAEVGKAKLYINASNGDLEIIFGDGTTKTIVVDT